MYLLAAEMDQDEADQQEGSDEYAIHHCCYLGIHMGCKRATSHEPFSDRIQIKWSHKNVYMEHRRTHFYLNLVAAEWAIRVSEAALDNVIIYILDSLWDDNILLAELAWIWEFLLVCCLPHCRVWAALRQKKEIFWNCSYDDLVSFELRYNQAVCDQAETYDGPTLLCRK